MTSVPAYLGLDYHDEMIEVNVMSQRGDVVAARSCVNSVQAVRRVVPRGYRVAGVANEACSGAADFAAEPMQATGWDAAGQRRLRSRGKL